MIKREVIIKAVLIGFLGILIGCGQGDNIGRYQEINKEEVFRVAEIIEVVEISSEDNNKIDLIEIFTDSNDGVEQKDILPEVNCSSEEVLCGDKCCSENQQCATVEQGPYVINDCVLQGVVFCGIFGGEMMCNEEMDSEELKICLAIYPEIIGGEKWFCLPIEECISEEICKASNLKIEECCKPLGGVDCLASEKGYCDPGEVCTHRTIAHSDFPACCPDDAQVACGNGKCCLNGNFCSYDGKVCVAPGEEYCGDGLVCKVGETCMKSKKACMPDNAKDCGDGTYCKVGYQCAGGNWKCCADDMIVCGNKCCEPGDKCVSDSGKNYCVPPGGEYCGNGVVCGPGKECCTSGVTSLCMPAGSDCCLAKGLGDGYCEPGKVCVDGSKCCPATAPKHCGNKCCQTTDSCEIYNGNGICVPSGADYCGNGKYCNPGYFCCGGEVCAPKTGKCCTWIIPHCCGGLCPKVVPITTYHACNPGKECCGDSCMPVGADCCEEKCLGNGYCSPGYVCVDGGKCCPAAYPNLCENGTKCCK
ncbi:MAG: hypothetical protein AB1333_04755 [Patescibacteria group bacterium]